MALLEMHGGFLYQHKPSLFPDGEVGGIELALWELHYHDKNQRMKNK